MGRWRISLHALIAAGGMSAIGLPAGAQSIPPSLGQAVTDLPNSPILTIDQDRLFQGSLYGKHLAAQVEALSNELAVENRGIEAQLMQEERDLTALRPTLTPQEFTARADAFDARVEEIRRRQDAKGRDLTRRRDLARAEFIKSVLPVLSVMMRDSGAVAILNAQAIFLSFGVIDITEAAIDRLDERIGAGPGLVSGTSDTGDEAPQNRGPQNRAPQDTPPPPATPDPATPDPAVPVPPQ